MKYIELKQKLEQSINRFQGMFFAFNQNQFNEGMAKLGLLPSETDKIRKICSGGFILASESKKLADLMNQNDKELKSFLSTPEGLFDALVYELGNHEYCITYDLEDTLYALELTRSDVPQDILKNAINYYLEHCC